MAVLPSLNSIRAGLTILINGEPYTVITANFSRQQQRKPVMQTKLKHLMTRKVIEINIKPGDRIEEAELLRTKADYLYKDQVAAYFMDTQTYEQYSIDLEFLGGKAELLMEGIPVDILSFQEKPISVSLPPKIDLTVVSAPPSIKGDSASNVTKQVTLETGLVVNVPLFIKEGDRVRVNTETLEYVERA